MAFCKSRDSMKMSGKILTNLALKPINFIIPS